MKTELLSELRKQPPPSLPDAKCAGMPVEFFFPRGDDRGGRSKASGERTRMSVAMIEEHNAKFCRGELDETSPCPHLRDCLEYAIRNNEDGIWGGTRWEDRRRMR